MSLTYPMPERLGSIGSHNQELDDLYRSPSTVTVVNLVCVMGGGEWIIQNFKGTTYWNVRETSCEVVRWMELAQDRVQWRVLVLAVLNLWVLLPQLVNE